MIPRDTQASAPTDRVLRQFAVLWILCFGTIAAVQEGHDGRRTVALVLALLATTVGPLGLVWPRTIRPIFVAWNALARPVGSVIAGVILGLVFYGLFTPVALVGRLLRRDALGVRRQVDARSYWRTKPTARNSAHYLRQF
jgi:hypothetical protein